MRSASWAYSRRASSGSSGAEDGALNHSLGNTARRTGPRRLRPGRRRQRRRRLRMAPSWSRSASGPADNGTIRTSPPARSAPSSSSSRPAIPAAISSASRPDPPSTTIGRRWRRCSLTSTRAPSPPPSSRTAARPGTASSVTTRESIGVSSPHCSPLTRTSAVRPGSTSTRSGLAGVSSVEISPSGATPTTPAGDDDDTAIAILSRWNTPASVPPVTNTARLRATASTAARTAGSSWASRAVSRSVVVPITARTGDGTLIPSVWREGAASPGATSSERRPTDER